MSIRVLRCLSIRVLNVALSSPRLGSAGDQIPIPDGIEPIAGIEQRSHGHALNDIVDPIVVHTVVQHEGW